MKVSNPSSKAGSQVTSGVTIRKKDANPLADLGSTKDSKVSTKDLGGSAKVDLSPKAQEAKKAFEIAKNTPDVDEAKVAKFRELIDSGKYKVDSKAVAEKMLDEELKQSFFDAE